MIKTWILSAVLIAGSALLASAANAPKYTTKEVMKALHKGDDAVAKKVRTGMPPSSDFAVPESSRA